MAKNKEKLQHKTSVGGQALIEGVMMQGPKGAAVSVRTPDGSIDTEMVDVKHAEDKFKPLGWPLIRGVVAYIESMLFGYKCLMMSAEKSGLEDIEESEENMSKLDNGSMTILIRRLWECSLLWRAFSVCFLPSDFSSICLLLQSTL
ncbi:MAG: DUF1385 domain-containing protein [Clostridia bacterium]|nr:DUF1385 domain-containing protein [Clostridia bacterium]